MIGNDINREAEIVRAGVASANRGAELWMTEPAEEGKPTIILADVITHYMFHRMIGRIIQEILLERVSFGVTAACSMTMCGSALY